MAREYVVICCCSLLTVGAVGTECGGPTAAARRTALQYCRFAAADNSSYSWAITYSSFIDMFYI